MKIPMPQIQNIYSENMRIECFLKYEKYIFQLSPPLYESSVYPLPPDFSISSMLPPTVVCIDLKDFRLTVLL